MKIRKNRRLKFLVTLDCHVLYLTCIMFKELFSVNVSIIFVFLVKSSTHTHTLNFHNYIKRTMLNFEIILISTQILNEIVALQNISIGRYTVIVENCLY